MIVLAIDTAGPAGVVGLVAGDTLLAAEELGPAGAQAERITGAIDDLLRAAGKRPPEIDLVAVATGPGSFTGLRIGMAAGQGFGLGIGRPVVGVPSLRLLAAWARQVSEGRGAAWISLIDARRGDLFCAAYADAPDDPLDVAELLAPVTVLPDRLWELLATVGPPFPAGGAAGEPPVFCGDGVPAAAPFLVAGPVPVRTVFTPRPPDAARLVGALGRRLFAREGAPAILEPLYLRPPDARKPIRPPRSDP